MNSHGGSNKLLALAHRQLSLYNNSGASGYNKVIALTRTGFRESATRTVFQRRRSAAAVLVCIFEDDRGELRVILTVRSGTVSTHPGEVSLPGGRREEGDEDDKDTATREADEEIGLDPSLVDVIAVLEPFFCKHLPKVTPVVGILKNKKAFKATPNPAEVEAIFDAPLRMFIKPMPIMFRRLEGREIFAALFRLRSRGRREVFDLGINSCNSHQSCINSLSTTAAIFGSEP